MSTGALVQLQAKNEFDDLLFTDDIKLSPFISSYKKITPFAEIPYSFAPTGSPSWGERITFKINKVADLISYMYLTLEIPQITVADIIGRSEDVVTSNYRVKWMDYLGYVIIERAILRIGGKIIQDMPGEYMMCYSDLYDCSWTTLKLMGHDGDLIQPQTQIFDQYIYVPLRFFPSNDYETCLPLNALRNQEIEVEIKLRNWDDVYLILYQLTDVKNAAATITDPFSYFYSHTHEKLTKKPLNNLRLDCNMIFLGSEEREHLLKNKIELLITQVQDKHQTIGNIGTIDLTFTNPIKEFYYLISKPEIRALGEIFNYSGKPKFIPFDSSNNMITTFSKALWIQIPEKHLLSQASFELNGVERIPWRDYKYWYVVQNYETFYSRPEHYIYLCSFGMNSKTNKGSCNFSEFESIDLNVQLAGSDIRRFSFNIPDYTINIGPESKVNITVYGVSYNILDIEDGMSELRFGM